ncbi:MAG: hypothetical protein P1U58_18200 [Verrucomicrobiales bacterium]|nr:hypothetical protein [Verrucomicrobiales bacterium]
MRRLLLSLLLPQIFLALGVGSAVTTCQAAWAFGIDLHEVSSHDAHHEHFHHGHSHGHDDDKTPCDGHCPSLVSEVTAPTLVKVPSELAPIALPPFALLPESPSGSSLAPALIPSEPPAPPSPPLPVLTGSFLI